MRTLIHTALFYGKNWNVPHNVVKTFDSSESSAIFIAKNISSDNVQKKS